MSITATKSGGDKAPTLEEGAYAARIYNLIHIGTVPGYQGKLQNKVRITFELPTETYIFKEEKGPQPRVISQEYTLSFSEKANLTKVINACDPKGLKTDDNGEVEEYDVEKLVGKSCLITVKHIASKSTGDMFAVIDNCTVLPKGMACPPQVNESKVLNYDTFNEEYFASLPTFLQDKIRASVEYKSLKGGTGEADISLDDIPF